jgi:excisionase family DNA binding protein
MHVKRRQNRLFITTGVVAAHCGVTYEAVAQWIRKGKLLAYTTPGGQSRIRVTDFQRFLDHYGLPPFDPAPSEHGKLLIVDDDAPLLRMMETFFTQTTDYQCATAANGFEAGIKAAIFRPDVMILDLMMPGLNGIEVCQRIKSMPETRHIRVLAITGHPERGRQEGVLAAGAEACLVKPVALETLHQHVGRLFEERGHPVQPRRANKKAGKVSE